MRPVVGKKWVFSSFLLLLPLTAHSEAPTPTLHLSVPVQGRYPKWVLVNVQTERGKYND